MNESSRVRGTVFIGREKQLGRLQGLLDRVVTDTGGKPGRAILIRGRRRVGKSRLVEEFAEQANVPVVFFTASTRPVAEELELFCEEVASSEHPAAPSFRGVQPLTWEAALRLFAAQAQESGSILVIDELPYLASSDPSFEGTLQKVFDRELSKHRILLIGVGSDLAMMEALNEYGRPFHQRATEMVVPPLSPAEVGSMLHLEPADAFDAYLVTGGLPLICDEWPTGYSLRRYLRASVNESTSALLVSAERALAAEFPAEVQARRVLGTIGAGERTFTNIGREAGGMQQGSLHRSLTVLLDKRVVAADQPLSTRASKDRRYRVADSYLRFWLSFLGPHMPEIERGRGDRVLARIERSWTSWRGRAIEPIIREALERLPPDDRIAPEAVVGGYWTRTNDPEIDVVLADKAPVASQVLGVGSIKWLERAPFDDRDLSRLVLHRAQLPGATHETPLVVVSRSGCVVDGVRSYAPEELVEAW